LRWRDFGLDLLDRNWAASSLTEDEAPALGCRPAPTVDETGRRQRSR
jgi:hypothetical protein